MKVDREIEAEIAAAVDGFAWVEAVFALSPSDATSAHADALSFAIVLAPYGIKELVQTHYEVLVATGAWDVTGRVLYVNGGLSRPTPLARARRITPSTEEREAANLRVARRRREAEEQAAESGAAAPRRGDLEHAFRQLAENASGDVDNAGAPSGPSPYRASKPLDEYSNAELQRFADRAFAGFAITATFSSGATVVEVVRDPFPAVPRRQLLVVDDDMATEDALRDLPDVDVTFARDGWTAIDNLTERDFDLVLCAVVLGDFTGAKIHRMASSARPHMASRMVFIARKSVVDQASPSSMSGRVLPRPVDRAAVLGLLSAAPRS